MAAAAPASVKLQISPVSIRDARSGGYYDGVYPPLKTYESATIDKKWTLSSFNTTETLKTSSLHRCDLCTLLYPMEVLVEFPLPPDGVRHLICGSTTHEKPYRGLGGCCLQYCVSCLQPSVISQCNKFTDWKCLWCQQPDSAYRPDLVTLGIIKRKQIQQKIAYDAAAANKPQNPPPLTIANWLVKK